MALTFFWRCEGTTLDGTDDKTDGDSTADFGGRGGSIDTATVRVGSNSINCADGDAYAQFVLSSDIFANVGSAAFWFFPDAWTNTQSLWRPGDASTADDFELEMSGSSSSGGLTFRSTNTGSSSNSVVSGDQGMTNGNWYFIIVRWSNVADEMSLEIWPTALDTVIYDSGDVSVTNANFPNISLLDIWDIGYRLGTSDPCHIDNVFVSDTYAEDLVGNATITSFTQFGGAPAGPNLLTLLGVG